MATNEERLKILQMLEDGKITAEDAATLLRALAGGGMGSEGQPSAGRPGRFIRVHVTDLDSGTSKVDVTLPLTMVRAGLNIAGRFAPGFEGMDVDAIEQAMSRGVVGKLVEVIDSEDRERVEVYVE